MVLTRIDIIEKRKNPILHGVLSVCYFWMWTSALVALVYFLFVPVRIERFEDPHKEVITPFESSVNYTRRVTHLGGVSDFGIPPESSSQRVDLANPEKSFLPSALNQKAPGAN